MITTLTKIKSSVYWNKIYLIEVNSTEIENTSSLFGGNTLFYELSPFLFMIMVIIATILAARNSVRR